MRTEIKSKHAVVSKAPYMLYMAFVTVANYSQSSFELGYALKFMRVMTLSADGSF